MRLFHDDDDEPHLAPGERYEYTLKNKSGDVVCHNYTTPSYTPDSPTPKPHFCVVGVCTPIGGHDKSVKPALTPKDKEQAKSLASSPSCSKIRRHRSPPPIKRPLEQYESSEEKTPNSTRRQSLRFVESTRS
ncbi:hypothetical protein C2845_PM04G11220 [Panicum miliaceum]|uniref:Uncharacterized protein n=1 Tax=Panicum miliaceum TaxID=4540 RepID=A0A3L6QNY2_PANMI|nr:hypothetical protein C2845_PM04G11220 [Panicum miliaceum]